MRPRTLAPVLTLVAVLALAGCGATGGQAVPSPAPSATAGSTTWFHACPAPTGPAHGDGLPAVSLPCFTGGRKVALNRAFGKPTVINLWASWCAPCRRELPEIAKYARAHPDVLVLTVDTQDTRTAGLSFARDVGVKLPTLSDPGKKLLTGVGRSALPVTLLVTADGRLADTYNSTPLTAGTLNTLVGKQLRSAP